MSNVCIYTFAISVGSVHAFNVLNTVICSSASFLFLASVQLARGFGTAGVRLPLSISNTCRDHIPEMMCIMSPRISQMRSNSGSAASGERSLMPVSL